jgi:hypothetical protein
MEAHKGWLQILAWLRTYMEALTPMIHVGNGYVIDCLRAGSARLRIRR